MKIVDINILIYAINEDAPVHTAIRKWWETSVLEDEPVGLPWVVILGFIRIVTNSRIMPHPLTPDIAVALVDDWLRLPGVDVIQPGNDHWSILREIFADLGTAANLTTDAHLAALAIEYGARLFSTDSDFARFQKLRWSDPLTLTER